MPDSGLGVQIQVLKTDALLLFNSRDVYWQMRAVESNPTHPGTNPGVRKSRFAPDLKAGGLRTGVPHP